MPERTFDVIVLGAGFAALSAAWHLRRVEGVESLCLLAREVPKGGTGLVQVGLTDHLNRVTEAVGADAATAIWRYSLSGVEAARELAQAAGYHAMSTGSHLLATFPAEARDLESSARLLEAHGLPGLLARGPLDGAQGRPRGLSAIWSPDDVVLSPPDVLRGLLKALQQTGVRVELGAVAVEVSVDGAGVAIGVEGRADPLRAEVCVLAAGADAPRLHPFFRDRVFPIHAQGFRVDLRHDAEEILSTPFSASWGHELYVPSLQGFDAAGMRPDSGAADVSYRTDVTETFQRFLEGFARQRVPALPEDLAIKERYAGTIGLPADGLPLIGPLPGSPRLVTASGLGFRGIAFACAAGRSLARLIAGSGATAGIPALLSPRRFLG